jgi:hypothetical protein
MVTHTDLVAALYATGLAANPVAAET